MNFNLYYMDLILHMQGQASQYLMLWCLNLGLILGDL